MKRFSLALAALVLCGVPAFACDDICKADEIYSDAEEMCVKVPALT